MPDVPRIGGRIGDDLKRGDRVWRRGRCVRCGWEGAVLRIVGSTVIPTCRKCGGQTEAVA